MRKLEEFKNKVIDWFTENSDDIIEVTKECLVIGGVSMGVLTVCYWVGHPEWALNERCKRMIFENLKKKGW